MKGTLKLLVVDDEIKVIGAVVKHALKEHTYQDKFFDVIGTPTSKEAYALLDKETVDLALVDLVLDEHEGLQGGMRVVKQITEMYHIPTMVLSSSDEQRDAIDSMRAGARDYINKKDIRSDLGHRINVVLDKYYREKASEIELQQAHEMLKQLTAVLRESEKKYRTLVELIPHIIYKIDAEGNFIFVNPAVKALGYDPEELKGKHFSTIVHPDDVKRISREYVLPKYDGKTTGDEHAPKLFDERRSGNRITKNLEVRIVPKTWSREAEKSDLIIGSLRSSGELTAVGIYEGSPDNEYNNFLGTIGVIVDITVRKQAEEELQKAEKLESLSVLAGGIAHDFNNLLAGLFGYIDMARVFGKPNQKIRNYLEKALLSYVRAKDLTMQLLTFAKGTAPVKKVVSLDKILTGSSQLALSGSNITCKFDLGEELLCIEADGDQISRVVNNIIINSRQAMPDGGTVTITGSNKELAPYQIHGLAKGQYVEIIIEDQGTGIPDKILPKIFDPFFTTKQQGSGLGLATSYSIINKHGGHISVDSKAGSGTTFTIYLPATEKQEEEDMEQQPEPALNTTGRILLMDDEKTVRQMAGELLETMGYDVVYAKNGEEAIIHFKEALEADTKFDAVILDLTVKGGMGGDKAIEKLLELDPDVKAIVSSGYTTSQTLAKPEKYGFKCIIPKPYRIEDITTVLNNVLKKEKK